MIVFLYPCVEDLEEKGCWNNDKSNGDHLWASIMY